MKGRPFVTAFEAAAPAVCRQGRLRRHSRAWNGERLFLHYDWTCPNQEAIAVVRLQLFPNKRHLWIGSIEIACPHRGQGLGTTMVRAIEIGAKTQRFETIRLFSRFRATGFWQKLGYQPEADPRYYRKSCLPYPSILNDSNLTFSL